MGLDESLPARLHLLGMSGGDVTLSESKYRICGAFVIAVSRLKSKELVFKFWHHFKDGEITRDEFIKRIEEGPKEDMKLWFKAGIIHEDCQNKTKATCMDFYNRFDMLWVFLRFRVMIH